MACHSLIHSSTLGNAIQRYCRFYRLIERGLIPALDRRGKFASISLTPCDPDYPHDYYAYEACLYYIHRFFNWLGNTHIQLQRVNLHYAQPIHVAEYRPLFFGAPVYFSQPATELLFSIALLKAPVVQDQQTLSVFLKRAIFEMLVQEYESAQWSSRIVNMINADLANIPELDDIANRLSLHPQTLRRRLHGEGTSFQELKNNLRRDYAIYRLSKTVDSIEDIALKTGFSEPSTFIRAFKSWTGMTPLGYRKFE